MRGAARKGQRKFPLAPLQNPQAFAVADRPGNQLTRKALVM
jgi:hypothetical protein